MITATATELKNNFGKYLQLVQEEQEVMILKNGKVVARLVSKDATVSYLTSQLTGVLLNDYDEKAMREEMHARHDRTD